ncbi:colicin E3/pyocin S6 family cytotoxin, partial [Microcoleus sp. D2_18a_D3]|uniref:colicin E3/pyocin S6 family cytotoxin n=1 Tax=Microcoleus sp. D2_18a_D3 TaxID=3055330 RepID=UPI002FD21BC8
ICPNGIIEPYPNLSNSLSYLFFIPYTSDRRKLAIDPNTARVTVVGTVSSNGLIWGAATKPATTSSPTDDVRQKFLYAASLYPQVGAAITGMQDQGGGVFRQEFERAIMIWNGQQVTVYETKGRSVSPTSPSPNPQPVNNNKKPVFQTQPPKTLPGVYFANSINNSGSSHASSSSSPSNSFSGNISSNSTSSSANASSASNISESTGNNNWYNSFSDWYNSFSDWGHGLLDVGGFWPGLGAIPDTINTGWYGIEGWFGKEGAWGNAALSGMAILPLFGDAAAGVVKGGKYINKADDLIRVTKKILPGESNIWTGFKTFRGTTKTNGLNGKERRYYEWDYTHNDIEMYDPRGNHLGTINPETGLLIKAPVAGRDIKNKIK